MKDEQVTENGVKIGIIMLNTDFPRPVGDIGNTASYQYPARIFKLSQANVANVVSQSLSEDIILEVIAAGKKLVAQGCNILTTSCGFLAPIQARVQHELGLPFIASSLCLLPFLRQCFGPNSPMGVITFDSKTLSPAHFNGHYDEQLLISGIENGQELHAVIKEGRAELDEDLALKDVKAAVQHILHHAPSCLLLECTNLSPYKNALRHHFALPVFDLVDAVHWLANAQCVGINRL